ncbi:MAG: response regulator [Acidimicrobiia bacterium]|nr:response regulator [Acidimicrobiia bacterium]
MFASRIRAAAKALGVALEFERSADRIVPRVRGERPTLVIFDLNATKLRPMEAIAAIRADEALRSATRTVGYVSHVQTDVIAAARDAGIDEVLARSAFTEQLGTILSITGSRAG